MTQPRNGSAGGPGTPGVDGIPGILDEPTLAHVLEVEFARARRYEHPFSLLRVSVAGGDGRALRRVAGALRLHTRWADSVGTLAPDALLVVLRDTPPEAARAAVDKIRAAVTGEVGAEDAGVLVMESAAWRKGDDLERLLARLA